VIGVVPVLFGVSLMVFVALRLTPGDPAVALAGMNADEDTLAAIRHEYGLDQPIVQQYVVYVGHVIRLDLGRSVSTHIPVAEELANRYPVTVALAMFATALATVVGVAFGAVAAHFQRRWIDYAVMILAVAGLSIPNYVLGILLILVFAVSLRVLPSTGASSPEHFILPVITIAASGAAILARQTRAAVVDVLGEDYIRTARAKGLAEGTILWRHTLRNALIPIITNVGLVFGTLMAGAVIIENVFGIPGIGKLMVDRISDRDYPTVQGAVLLVAASYVFVNLLVDIAYVVIDRRVRLD
jgi:ABC-type dipeptide/oligopeptide/nickel transport system permease component